MKQPELPEVEMSADEYHRLSRRSIFLAGLGALAGGLGFRWLKNTDLERGVPWPLRASLGFGDGVFKANFKDVEAKRRGPAANPIRRNGDAGMEDEIELSSWKLEVQDPELLSPLSLKLEDIKKLPAVDLAFEFKCIEGWSQNVECRGARFSDFMKANDVGSRSLNSLSGVSKIPYNYALLKSINGGYYVSMDMKSLMHPQTLLCYEMSGQPLTAEHGAPLRLMTPVKYGVKNIKQIGSIAFMDSPPADYWAERGYGEYLGL